MEISNDSGVSGRAGRDAYLDALTDDPALPSTPTITYSGDAQFPQDGLAFTSSDFSDPQGAGTFQAMEWRLAEVSSLGGGTSEIMPGGRIWSYLDNDVDQGTAWREPGFDDSLWSSGASPLCRPMPKNVVPVAPSASRTSFSLSIFSNRLVMIG